MSMAVISPSGRTTRPSQQCSPRQVRDTSLSDSIAGRNASASTTITSSSRRAGKTWSDLLSRSIAAPNPSVPSHDEEPALIQALYAPLQPVVTLEELNTESGRDPILSKLCTYIRNGWPSHIPEELKPFARVKDELSCWADTCVSRGLCTVVPNTLRARVVSCQWHMRVTWES